MHDAYQYAPRQTTVGHTLFHLTSAYKRCCYISIRQGVTPPSGCLGVVQIHQEFEAFDNGSIVIVMWGPDYPREVKLK